MYALCESESRYQGEASNRHGCPGSANRRGREHDVQPGPPELIPAAGAVAYPDPAVDPCDIVTRAVEAFNRRRLAEMLELVCEDVEIWPLRPSPLGVYRGRQGVALWFSDLRRRGRDDRIVIRNVRLVGQGRVVVIGSVDIGVVNAAFTAVHDLRGPLIASAHHYFSDEMMLERLGLID
jgi:hypothetical protein